MTSLADVINAKATAEVAEELLTRVRDQCRTIKIDFAVDAELEAHSEFALIHAHNVLTELRGVLKYWPVIPARKE